MAMDDRTNTLLVKDTALNIERVRQLVGKLDVPVRQLLIDSRIVIASDNFTRNLGMKFTQVSGGSGSSAANATGVTYGGNPSAGSSQAIMGSLFDLAAADPRAKIGFTVLRAAGSLLELELSAGQLEGTAETLSNPRLLASDGTKSFIKQGTAIPVQSGGSATTAPTIKYVEAVLLLEVTPHIAPDENVMLELKITKDAVGELVTTSSRPASPTNPRLSTSGRSRPTFRSGTATPWYWAVYTKTRTRRMWMAFRSSPISLISQGLPARGDEEQKARASGIRDAENRAAKSSADPLDELGARGVSHPGLGS
ncbi:secretin N-terminal domain-containing protein [Methylogaea oryzae]|uniref:secretin N-terminal domain-containing protein n=1 Tax=Methylogaea oryzae TaxID=1295382 RepID=UPI0009E78840